MKTTLLIRVASVLSVVPILLSAQALRDSVPLRHWAAPLYWQPNLAELRPLTSTPIAPTPLTFIAMTPCRVVDTRTRSGFTGMFGAPSLVAGVARTIPMQSSTTCTIPSTALAYSLNITVVPPSLLGYITVWPTDQGQPLVSTLNDLTGTVVANAAIVPAGSNGSINVYASNTTDLIIDINGYYAASFGTPSGGYEFPNTSGTALMTIAPNGNVGIGTGNAVPGSMLDVAGSINFTGVLNYQGSAVLEVAGGASNHNTSLGLYALPSSTTATGTTAVGAGALGVATGGFHNTAIGAGALASNSGGCCNTATGWSALSNNTGTANTATGGYALGANSTGNNNTAYGYHALYNNTSGSNNIAVGADAGLNVLSSNNIHIGTIGAGADSGTIRIGGNTALGDPVAQSQFFVAGVAGSTVSGVPVLINTTSGQLGVASSSRRYKENIQDMGDASAGLMHLRPVTFRYQKPFADGSKPIQYGLIAEEVAEVYPDLVAHSADGQIETVKYQVLDSMLLNEVQRLNKENQALQERLSRLEAAVGK